MFAACAPMTSPLLPCKLSRPAVTGKGGFARVHVLHFLLIGHSSARITVPRAESRPGFPKQSSGICGFTLYPHASPRSINDLHAISAQAAGLQDSKMFSTWSAIDASSTVASSDSPIAKRRRISESTHGRRTSKATRACDVCKVNTSFLLLVSRCEISLARMRISRCLQGR